jgi:serine protease Do
MRALLLAAAIAVCALSPATQAQTTRNDTYAARNTALAQELADSMVVIRAQIVDGAATAETLGRARAGSGILIGPNLVLTIGYLVMEADKVEVVGPDGKTTPVTRIGYDHTTGFGLLRTLLPVRGKVLDLGDSDALPAQSKVLTIGAGEDEAVEIAVLARERFVGSWEYAIDRAIYTFPPVENWSGSALVSEDGKLVGVGSLILRNAAGTDMPGNMFVPVNLLKPILTDLAERGRAGGAVKPWMGMTVDETAGALVVSRVTRGGPAHTAGVRRGDVVVGVGNVNTKNLAEFFDSVWAAGAPGVQVKVRMLIDSGPRDVTITTMDRRDFLRQQTVQ